MEMLSILRCCRTTVWSDTGPWSNSIDEIKLLNYEWRFFFPLLAQKLKNSHNSSPCLCNKEKLTCNGIRSLCSWYIYTYFENSISNAAVLKVKLTPWWPHHKTSLHIDRANLLLSDVEGDPTWCPSKASPFILWLFRLLTKWSTAFFGGLHELHVA